MAMTGNDITANYHGGSPNSVAANKRATNNKRVDRQRIVSALRRNRRRGLTCEEIEIKLGMKHQTASARLTDLKRAGDVTVIGRRGTLTGSPAGINFLTSELAPA